MPADQGSEGPPDRPRYPPSPPAAGSGGGSRRLTPRTPAAAGSRSGRRTPYGDAPPRAPSREPSPAPAPATGRRYKVYRAGSGSGGDDLDDGGKLGGGRDGGRGSSGGGGPSWLKRPHITPKRLILGLLALIVGWLVLSLVLFLISSHFERISPPANVASALESAGNPLTSANNILVLGSDKREKTSKEPGADPNGPSRSDTIMLIRTGDGHASRLSIPRDTVIEIPGHGLQKINAAYAYGGPKLSIEVIKEFLGIPINHLVEVNFESFPALINSMGGVNYTGGCIDSEIAGGASDGGYSLELPAGTHRLDGRQALILARTRENKCAPGQDDINREEHQQALFEDMKKQLLSPLSFLRLPLIAWNTPPAIISDMSSETLLTLFASLAIDGSSPIKVMKPTGATTLPDGEEGLTITEEAKRQAVAEFMKG